MALVKIRQNDWPVTLTDMSWRKDSYLYEDYDIAKSTTTESQYYLEIASKVAKKSTMAQQHGCILVYKSKVVSSGYNSCMDQHKFSIHAEMDAINKAKKILTKHELKNCKLYVVRIGQETMNFPLKYSKPCPKCLRIISSVGIERVFYSINSDTKYCQLCS